ncbi:hypothetical protein G7054_g2028 [Neopestalotiopsis clavispora]|nr:hypothetical protein G7054_g2028 [Neopestalotiopsis clavispora]
MDAHNNNDYKLPLEGKLALVTGASRGIGEGIAFELASRGASVVLAYASPSSEAKINTLKTKIESLPHRPVAYPVRADLSSVEGAGQIISSLLEWTGNDLHLDILVNNAGLERVKSLAEISIDDYDAVYNLNVRGIILLTQAALPYLGAGARIVNLGSVGARAGFQSLSLYCSSKAALEGRYPLLGGRAGGQWHHRQLRQPWARAKRNARQYTKGDCRYAKGTDANPESSGYYSGSCQYSRRLGGQRRCVGDGTSYKCKRWLGNVLISKFKYTG